MGDRAYSKWARFVQRSAQSHWTVNLVSRWTDKPHPGKNEPGPLLSDERLDGLVKKRALDRNISWHLELLDARVPRACLSYACSFNWRQFPLQHTRSSEKVNISKQSRQVGIQIASCSLEEGNVFKSTKSAMLHICASQPGIEMWTMWKSA